ncbi:hypothetical protein [Pseudomonas sp. PB3P13]
MSNYSLAALTTRMQGKSVTLGWDAVVFMNRAKVNSLLQQQYISRFNKDSFLKQIFGAPAMTPAGDEVLQLSGLILSEPMVNFAEASLRNSRVTATMNIVSGTVSYVSKGSVSEPETILYSYVVGAQQGFTVTMDIDLKASKGTVNEQGKVSLDIGDGYNCRCNLVKDGNSQLMLGEFFKALFLEQKPEDRLYTLGMLDLRDVDLLAPRSFIIRTMATDEGKIKTSDDYGDGAVVLFVRTKGNPDEGDEPTEGSLDYLIPNDRDAQGKALYSGSLVLASRVVFDWYIQDYMQKVINNGNLRLERSNESDHLSRGLYAVSGEQAIEGHSWRDTHYPLEYKEILNNGPLAFKYANKLAENSLRIFPNAKNLLQVELSGLQELDFTLRDYFWPWKDDRHPGVIPVMPNIKVEFSPVVNSYNAVNFVSKADYSFDINTSVLVFDGEDYPEAVQSRIYEKYVGVFKGVSERLRESALKDSFGIPEINALAISNLLFPERNALQLTQARLPGDLLMVGHIDPKETTFTLDPLTPVIKAGAKQQFTIRQLGIKSADVTWSVRSIDGVRAKGDISSNGEYTAPAVQLLEGTAARNVVTATYTDATTGKEVTASALVTVTMAGVVVTPSIVQINMRDDKAIDVKLTAMTLGGGTLKWALRGNQGSLSANQGNEVTYTRPQTPPTGTLETVLIDIEDSITGEKSIATVLLLNGNFSLKVTPAFIPGLRANSRALLKGPEEAASQMKWSMVAGEGDVDPDTGEFTAPSVITQPYSVVKGTLAGAVSGYSIIHLSDHARQSNWFKYDVFDFAVDPKPTRVWANGLQQARVVVRFRATDYPGAPDPLELSEDEYKSISLVSAEQHIPLPEVGEDGVPEGGKWYFTEDPNGYKPHPDSATAHQLTAAPGQPRVATMHIKEFFVQCHKVENLMVAASIRSDNYETFYSNPGTSDGEVNHKARNLVAVEPPEGGTIGQVVLTFGDNPPTRVEGDKDDEVDLNTTDYYYLKLLVRGVQVGIKSIEFDRNTSMIKWESDTQLEDVYSITGYALADDKDDRGNQILHIDEILLRRLGPNTQVPAPIVNPSAPVPKGQVLFSLHRREYWQFDKYAKADFDTSLHVKVIDDYGNRHSVRIGFDGVDRNKLKIIGS